MRHDSLIASVDAYAYIGGDELFDPVELHADGACDFPVPDNYGEFISFMDLDTPETAPVERWLVPCAMIR